jgi:hypothetical protein
MPTLTPILGLTVPTVGSEDNTWGDETNLNYPIWDALGAGAVVNVASSFLITAGIFPEKFYRVTTGGLTVPGTLPDPGTIPTGKIFTIKILDVGGSINLVCVNNTVTIDGNLTYFLTNQFAVVRLLANGATYDVVGVV